MNEHEALIKIKKMVKKIGKGYTCNFYYRGTGEHFINGANTVCFSFVDGKIETKSVGGSRFFDWDNKFNIEEFIKSLPDMLLTCDECNQVYRGILNNITK